MQELAELQGEISKLLVAPDPEAVVAVIRRCRDLVASRSKSASQADADFFRDMLLAIAKVPNQIATEPQIELIIDIARYFYVSGRAIEAIEPLQRAQTLAQQLGKASLIRAASSSAGVIYFDTGNVPRAMESYSVALEAARSSNDVLGEGRVWLNIGSTLIYTAEYEEAMRCFAKVLELAEACKELKPERISALSNIAVTSLHSGKFARGLSAAEEALRDTSEPQNASQMYSRVLLENNAARLYMATENFESAKIHVEAAKQYAALSKSPRAELEAAIAEGLYLVYAGHADMGLSRLMSTLERARFLKSTLRDVLIALTKAYEHLRQPDRALIYFREMLESNRNVQQEKVLKLLKLDMKQVEEELEAKRERNVALRQHEKILLGQVAEQELFKSRIEMLERLAVTAELRDDSTGEHSFRVGKLASLLAQEYGCDEDTIFMIDLAGRLHDIGKVGIPDAILLKPDKLNPAEYSIMRTHAAVGAELLSKSNIPHLQMAEEIARYHHEWWDGSGYSSGLAGNAIPLAARITALADVYDALTHKRPYKEAWPVDLALDEILRLKGKQFDPELTDMFLVLMARLRREFTDLDTYLGQAASRSPFLQARSKIWETLRRSKHDDSGHGSRLDVQR